MNGIIINDKQYIFLIKEGLDCDECDLKNICSTSCICESMEELTLGINSKNGIFRELKMDK
jgi:hypothetical protein